MTKKLFITAIAAILSITASAQNDLYTFTQSTGTYDTLNGGALVSPSAYPGNGSPFTIVLPFNITVNQTTSNAFNISPDGLMTLVSAGTGKKEMILAGWLDLEEFYDGTSGVYTLTEGTTGSRIFKVEFRKFNPSWGDSVDYINWQAWFYEGSNNIVLHYGDNNNFDVAHYVSGSGPVIGILHTDTTIINIDSSFFLTGNSSSPTMVYDKPNPGLPPVLSSHIPANTKFTFTRKANPNTSAPEVTGVSGFSVNVYPNPATSGKINVSVNNSNSVTLLTLTDLQGRTLQTQILEAGETQATFNAADLSAGIYLVTAQTNGEAISQKICLK